MHALFAEGRNALRSAVCSFFGGILLAILVSVGIGAPQAVSAVGACSFSCAVTLGASAQNCTETAPPYSTCSAQCTQLCGAIGMTYDTRDPSLQSTCSAGSEIGLGRPVGRCSPCLCMPTTALTCAPTSGPSQECGTACTNTCRAAAASVTAAQGAGSNIACAAAPVPQCVEVSRSGEIYLCRACITRCLADTTGSSQPAPRTCYTQCSSTSNPICVGVSEAEAGVTSGVVSGSGDSRSRIQSGTSAAANEAASLPPGACVQRAIAADAANNSLIRMAEATFGAASTTWTCRRVCSQQEQGGCVLGGCPGDASVRCCAPSLGIPVAQQCGARGAATDGGAASGEGAPSTGGAGTDAPPSGGSGAPGTTPSGGGVTNQVVGSSHVQADSGGLTRLILPSCIEDGGCQISDVFQVGLNLIRFLFGLAGVLLLVVFVYAGIEFLIAGDAGSVKTATDRIKKALIGLFFMFFGYTLVNFLVGMFVNA